MPVKPKQAPLICKYFEWHLRTRNGVFYADGRSGKYNLGKHSLGTRDREQALSNLRLLDLQMATDYGLVKPLEKTELSKVSLSIEKGWTLYLEHCGRSQILGGVAPKSFDRYQLVCGRHSNYAATKGISTWNEFNHKEFEKYGNWLFKNFAYRTCYMELTQLKTAINWFIKEKLLPPECRIDYPLRKPQGTDTYCYHAKEVSAMIQYCDEHSKLEWLGNTILALSHLGLRISELANLRWSDVNFEANIITIADERTSGRMKQTSGPRTTKGRRTRTIPMHPKLKEMLLSLTPGTDGRVFHGEQGGVFRPNNALKIFKTQVIEPLTDRFSVPEGEIGFQHGTFHSFRHYFCSQCFLCGASEGEVRSWLGHQDSKMVEHYRHLRDEDAIRKMQQITFLSPDEEVESGFDEEA